jgi:PsbP
MMYTAFLFATLLLLHGWEIGTIAAFSPLAPITQNNLPPPSPDSISRRSLLESTVAAGWLGAGSLLVHPEHANAAAATTTTLTKYEDANCKFSINLPSDWTQSTQTLPDRRKIVLYIKPDSDQKTLIFLAYTPVRDDFTSLSSFGSVDEVAQATILPKGELAGVKGVESAMLGATVRQQAYFFDYTQKVPSQPETHFRTIFALAMGATGGAGNVLVTITAQTPESEYGVMKPLFDDIMKSYA